MAGKNITSSLSKTFIFGIIRLSTMRIVFVGNFEVSYLFLEFASLIGLLLLYSSWSRLLLSIQGGNFNWNKIHNTEIGNVCKKYRNRSIFSFPCPILT
jgi:hypothetical protein